MEGFATLVRESKRVDPLSGALYVFWDGTGLCLFAKRLETGSSAGEKSRNGVMRMSVAQLSARLDRPC
ncbi:IS66 family insertion sequence element accessory protein TnpB [Bradyrhizobium sp. 187]|uniref:IS66 family insertion sequence element accessory protein TnpB n=1 Tax=Bradyrhizobium sp. 187 TaxID=2782655 RepID=UPI00200004E5|nr:IS66 family insertion sequence element accessory protein TnpB [Bradyrhizobium sp. 187]UPJ76996.1 IS66 family insertion sequence element accessory protein TnpB [Bradyrhizobium sp. 187]